MNQLKHGWKWGLIVLVSSTLLFRFMLSVQRNQIKSAPDSEAVIFHQLDMTLILIQLFREMWKQFGIIAWVFVELVKTPIIFTAHVRRLPINHFSSGYKLDYVLSINHRRCVTSTCAIVQADEFDLILENWSRRCTSMVISSKDIVVDNASCLQYLRNCTHKWDHYVQYTKSHQLNLMWTC